METKKKLLSIITVVKNDVDNIESTITSILSQKFRKIEYIIIDGKSTDGTISLIKKYKKKIDKVMIAHDKGIYDAMNKGIKIASGEYIGFCNSGDVLKKNSIKTICKFLDYKTDVLFATVKRNYIGSYIIKSGYDLKRLNYNFDFATSHSTGFYIKKKFHRLIGFYEQKFKCSADYDFYLRLFKNKNLNIKKTSKNKIIGEVQSGGYSSTLSKLEHLNEETKIRFNNKQNILLILAIYINTLIKMTLKKLKVI
jgi:glycosyltransferase involved in cell wall biosynthesis